MKVFFFPRWSLRTCLFRLIGELKDCSQCWHGYFFTFCWFWIKRKKRRCFFFCRRDGDIFFSIWFMLLLILSREFKLFHLISSTNPYLPVFALHMWNVGISLWKPLETLATRPTVRFHSGSAVPPLHLLSGTVCVFDRHQSLLLLDGSVLAPVGVVRLSTLALRLWCCGSYVHGLAKKKKNNAK